MNYLKCQFLLTIAYTFAMTSCTESRENIVDYQVGSVLQYADMIVLNKKFMDRALNYEFAYDTDFCIDDYAMESFPWRENIEKKLNDKANGYSGVIIFNTSYSDDQILEFFFARKPNKDSFDFVYLGVVDGSEYVVRDHYEYREKK